MPIAKAKGTLRIAAPTEMPTASTNATIIVARTNADSWCQAMTPEESTRGRVRAREEPHDPAPDARALVEEEEEGEERDEQARR